MARWLWAIFALVATVASAGRVTTFAWNNGADWPSGTTVELCINGVCTVGLTGNQHTLNVPVIPGGVIDAKVRGIPPAGYQCGDPIGPCPPSAWGVFQQTWPNLPINPWAQYKLGELIMPTWGPTTIQNNLYDGQEQGGTSWNASGYNGLGINYIDTGNWNAGFAFQLPAIPAGSTITKAYLRWYATMFGSLPVRIGVRNADPADRTYWNSSTLPSAASYIGTTDITLTTGTGWRMGESDTNPVNLSNHFNSLLSSYGEIVAGDIVSLAIWMTGTTNYAEVHDSSLGANDPQLYLEWTEGGSATALPRRALDGPFYGHTRGSVR